MANRSSKRSEMLHPIKIPAVEPKPVPAVKPPASKSRLKKLFEKQFPKLAGAAGEPEPEPNTMCLDRMVLSFMEDSNEKPSARCSRSRCNCFNGNCDDSSDHEFSDDPPPIPADAADIVKGLVHCESSRERNFLADASKVVDSANKTRIAKNKNGCTEIVAENLRSLGFDASVCRSHWEKTPSIPAGDYSYIDVIIDADRFILDIDFRSEFEIARSTKNYRSVLQSLPTVFVGKSDRLQKIIAVVSEAARLSLKKKGLHLPPWRKPEYIKAKWLSPYDRIPAVKSDGGAISAVNFNGEFEMRQEPEKITVVVSPWKPPPVSPKAVAVAGAKIVTGFSSVLIEKPHSPTTIKNLNFASRPLGFS